MQSATRHRDAEITAGLYLRFLMLTSDGTQPSSTHVYRFQPPTSGERNFEIEATVTDWLDRTDTVKQVIRLVTLTGHLGYWDSYQPDVRFFLDSSWRKLIRQFTRCGCHWPGFDLTYHVSPPMTCGSCSVAGRLWWGCLTLHAGYGNRRLVLQFPRVDPTDGRIAEFRFGEN